jgi:quinolinate synthase
MQHEIDEIRRKWGRKLLILGHYYQADDVIRHADVVGDSLELARRAAAAGEAERIVFCGVLFMAESADILSRPEQTVLMPDVTATCPMAVMAWPEGVRQAWSTLTAWEPGWIPVAYVNSTAAVKAFCGEQGGLTCTSANAPKVFRWAFDQGKKIFFLPDEHLGANTAHDLGLQDEAVALYDPALPEGGLTREAAGRARIVAWKGFCYVHAQFTVQDVTEARRRYPAARVVVHPESPKAVVRESDAHGSTSQIIRYVEQAPAGSVVVVGTELNLVRRLARRHAGRVEVVPLRESSCRNMALTTEMNLLRLLREWPARNEVHVPAALAGPARVALARMLDL